MLKKLRKMLKKEEGFTLVELMIVVVILGILAGIGVQQYVKVQERAKGAAHNANLRIISSAVNMYVMLEPESIKDLGENIKLLETKGYLQKVPVNPFGDEENSDPWVGSYNVKVYRSDDPDYPDDDGYYVITDGTYRIIVSPKPYSLQGTSD